MNYRPCSVETSRKSRALTNPEPLRPPRPVAGDLYFSLSMILFPLDCGGCSLLDHSLFSFMWCLFPLGPLPVQTWVASSDSCGACTLFDHSLFSVGLLAVLHVVLALSLTSPVQPWVDSHAPSGLVNFDVNKKLNENTVLECTSKQFTCEGANKCECSAFIYYDFSILL